MTPVITKQWLEHILPHVIGGFTNQTDRGTYIEGYLNVTLLAQEINLKLSRTYECKDTLD